MGKNKNIQNVPREMTHHQLSRFKKQQRRQRIILFSCIGVLLAVVLIIVGGWVFGVYMPLHKTVFQVYDTKIDASFYLDTLVMYGRSQGVSYIGMLANSISNQIVQNELIKQEAAKLGYTVSDVEVNQQLLGSGLPINEAVMEAQRSALLIDDLKKGYFTTQVPASDTQYDINAMMLESESIAQLVREKVIHGENFSELAKQYGVDTYSKEYNGDYGEHPIGIIKDKFLTSIPLDYISSPDVKTGDVSQPLSDNATKKLGYWLIRVNDRQITMSNNLSLGNMNEEESKLESAANVSALLLGSLDEANAIRARLLAGEALGPIAEQYSQYEISQKNQGELGLITASQNVSVPFDSYVSNMSVNLGQWSEPIRDDTFYYTKGGFWIIKVVEKTENKPLSSEDRDKLISDSYSKWIEKITQDASPHIINNISEDLVQWAIEKATEILQSEKK